MMETNAQTPLKLILRCLPQTQEKARLRFQYLNSHAAVPRGPTGFSVRLYLHNSNTQSVRDEHEDSFPLGGLKAEAT